MSRRAAPGATVVKLVLPFPPSLNRMVRRSGNRVHVSEDATQYKQEVGWTARVQGVHRMLEGLLRVTLHLYRPQKRGDLDNYSKSLLDGLSGVVWIDDDQIVELHMFRHDDRARPRVELEIEEILL